MLFRNKEQERALDFVERGNWDMFCLQEVPEDFLEKLKALPYPLAYAIDVERATPRKENVYLVILSRFPITAQASFAFPDYWHTLPARTKVFVRLMRPFHWTRISNRNGIYADLDLRGVRMRVFNLHLVLARPELRLAEFERAMHERDPETPTIVCGDLNTLERPHITLLNWLSSGTLLDWLLHRRERASMESLFARFDLVNPLRGHSTHPISRSQLDHILLSPHFSLVSTDVVPDRHGSDHHPISAEVNIA